MKHILSSGIIIEDNRSIQCGIIIHQDSKFVSLCYGRTMNDNCGFYLSTKGMYLDAIMAKEYKEELDLYNGILKEANEIL